MRAHDGIVDWTDADITDEIARLIRDAIPDVITSYSDTETYMLKGVDDEQV
jgi:LmbE family N-acetylglucosaminyl deacetylase